MLQSVKAIVLKSVNYSETSVIIKAYTDLFGVQSYIINRVRTSKSKNRQSMVQALSLLNMEVYHHANRSLNRIKEVNFDVLYKNIPFNIVKGSIILFLQEVLLKCLKEEEANEALFRFLHHALLMFDREIEYAGNFHLSFLIELSSFLGFYPSGSYSTKQKYFDAADGSFTASASLNTAMLLPHDAEKFSRLMTLPLNRSHEIVFSSENRKTLLNFLLQYYAYHLNGFGKLRSHKILETVLSA